MAGWEDRQKEPSENSRRPGGAVHRTQALGSLTYSACCPQPCVALGGSCRSQRGTDRGRAPKVLGVDRALPALLSTQVLVVPFFSHVPQAARKDMA